MKKANEALETMANKRINEIWGSPASLDSKMRLLNNMLVMQDYAIYTFQAMQLKITSGNGGPSLIEIMGSTELGQDHKRAFAVYLLKNNVQLIEGLLQYKSLNPSVKGIVQQAIMDFKQNFPESAQTGVNNSNIINEFLEKQNSRKTKLAKPLNKLADTVHETTRKRGLPDGAASATTGFFAAAVLFGTGIGPAIAMAAAAGYIGGHFGDKPDDPPTAPMHLDDEYEALLALREPIAGLMSKQVSVANMMFAASNIMNCASIKNAFENPQADFKPMIIETGGGCCVFFKNNENILKMGVMRGKPSAEGTEVSVISVSDVLRYKSCAPTKTEYSALPKDKVVVKNGVNGITVMSLDTPGRKLKL